MSLPTTPRFATEPLIQVALTPREIMLVAGALVAQRRYVANLLHKSKEEDAIERNTLNHFELGLLLEKIKEYE